MIRFAVIGTNWITRQFVDAAHETGKLKLTAVYSRSLEQAQSFANDYLVEHLFTSLVSESVYYETCTDPWF